MISLSLPHEPTVIVIFGASGDLTQRKVLPALYNLFLDHWLPERFIVIGFARTSFTETSFREHLRGGVDQFSRRGKTNGEEWQAFAPHIHYMSADYGDSAAYATLSDSLSKMDGEGHTKANGIFYLATPPGNVEVIVQRLEKANLARDRKQDRIVIERPFGRDLSSARTLTSIFATLFMRADQVEAAWSVVTPILEGWESVERPDFPNYSAGTWGPPEADQIIAGAGGWRNPKPEEAPE